MDTTEQVNAINLDLSQTWGRLFSILNSAKKINSAEACHRLSELPTDERAQAIRDTWGEAALTKCQPMLGKIASTEEALARLALRTTSNQSN